MYKAYFIGGPMDGCIKRLGEISKTYNFMTYSNNVIKAQGRFSLTEEDKEDFTHLTGTTHTYVKYGDLPQTVHSREKVAVYHYLDATVPQHDEAYDYMRYVGKRRSYEP